MPRRYFVLIAFLLLFSAAFLMIAFRRQPPVIPADADHRDTGDGRGRWADCMSCHGPGKKNARGPNHPFGERCGECHFEAAEAWGPR